MADSKNPSTVTLESNPQQSQDHLNPPLISSTPPQAPPSILTNLSPNPNPNPSSAPSPAPIPAPIPPPSISYPPPFSVVPPSAPSFRPVAQFSPVTQNPIFQNPNVQNPAAPAIGIAGATVPPPMMAYQTQNPNLRPPFAPMPNGFAVMHGGVPPQGVMQIPGLPRYPSPYQAMVRPVFPQRPLGPMGVLPRPPIPGVRPMIPTIIRPIFIPTVTPAEKPLTTVYVGKISQTVENDFILSLLQFCGPVKSWKRAQDPSNGAPKGFGFCEFESAEGVLRALRLLSKFNIDGQELVLNVDQATRGYLEKYVEKKTENYKKLREAVTASENKEDGGVANEETKESPKPAPEKPKEGNETESKDNDNANFGNVTDDDREADRVAMEKLTGMIDERLKTRPLPPPPALAPGDVPGNSNSEVPAKPKDGDSDPDTRNDIAGEKHDDESTSDNKQSNENDKPETSSPDRNRRNDRRSRERDRERDLKREKEREIERYERETERERVRKERDQRRKIEEADRQFEEYLKEWEYREREKEKQRHYEKEKEKERERKRWKEVIYEEEDEDEESRKRWRRSTLEEKRKKRQREKEDDLYDRQKEEEEIVEAKRREEELRLKQLEEEALKSSFDQLATNETDKVALAEESGAELNDTAMGEDERDYSSHENHTGNGAIQNGTNGEEQTMLSVASSDTQHGGNIATKKLGFGLVGSGKRTAVLSVFNAEEDDEAQKEKKMRPLVPIDYSTEEIQAVQQSSSEPAQTNLAAAAEFAKQLASSGSKEGKSDHEKERSSRRSRHESRDKSHDAGPEKAKGTENKKLIDAKQLIDMIPRTKEELFSYQINWAVYDEHALHERMRPWIAKKITEFLGEEEDTLVDYIVTSTQEHVEADHMLQLLQSILDEEAEMFVLKMWRMLIFEIKKVETGLTSSRNRQ